MGLLGHYSPEIPLDVYHANGQHFNKTDSKEPKGQRPEEAADKLRVCFGNKNWRSKEPEPSPKASCLFGRLQSRCRSMFVLISPGAEKVRYIH